MTNVTTMEAALPYPLDPRLDLVLERVVDVPRELVWSAWTEPERVKRWFTPAPWSTTECAIDLRPGGAFQVTMRSPEGQDMPLTGCYLEVVANERLVWTSMLLPGYRPSVLPSEALPFTAFILLEQHGAGTKYTAIARHGSEPDRERHAAMGFQDGWGKALDQLVAFVRGE